MKKTLLFIKPLNAFPSNESKEADIPEGTTFQITDSEFIPLRVNNSFMAGDIFLSINTIITGGYAEVING